VHPNTTRPRVLGISAIRLVIGSVLLGSASIALLPAGAARADTPGGWTVSTVLAGSSLHHAVSGVGTEPLTQPDDLARLEGTLFTVFQNNVGPDGSPSPTGNVNTTVVAFTPGGEVEGQWDIAGHADGIAADPVRNVVVVTVNEDGNSSLFTINPSAPAGDQVHHYAYDPSPLPHGGGTDAVSFWRGALFVSASAPAVANGPALYEVDLDGSTAHLAPVFGDQATATVANTPGSGATTTLGLTDPDSNAVVPRSSPRFGGWLQLDSQGDQQQVFVSGDERGGPPSLQALNLSQSVNDSAWATDRDGTLFVTEKGASDVLAVRGPFGPGTPFVAVSPCNANSAPTTCPAPGFSANYLGTEDLFTGNIEPVSLPAGTAVHPQGLLFVGG
jgi:hypothetical protein